VWWWNGEAKTHESCEYRANGEMPSHMAETKWRSPIFMPRWASRLTLEITGVKVERVQDISSRDAWNEGATCSCTSPVPQCAGNIDAFRNIWDSINAKRGYGWDANPWVWVVEFRQIKEARP